MGVTGFLNFLRTKHPDLVKTGDLSAFAYTRVFVDISSYIYKYMCIFGKTGNSWIYPMLGLAKSFNAARVHFVPVFDGKPPAEKGDEIADRREKRQKNQERIERLEVALNNYNLGFRNEDIYSVLEGELKSLEARKNRREPGRLKYKSDERLKKEDIAELTRYLGDIKKQQIFIKEPDITMLKEAFSAIGVSWIQAPCESEDYCCLCIKSGLGRAVISCDSDCLIHGAENLITNLDKDGTITFINVNDVLERLEVTPSQLIDVAIMLGCDYNRHVKTNKCGPVSAFNWIKKYGTIENIPDDLLGKECLLLDKCRRLFNSEETVISIPRHFGSENACAEVAEKYGLKVASLLNALATSDWEQTEFLFQEG